MTETDVEDDEIITDPKKMPPLIPVVILIYCNFSFLFNYVLLETLTSTLAMDQWAWSPEHAVERMGFIIMGAGALGVLVFG